MTLDRKPLSAGDGAAIQDEAGLDIKATEQTELLLFELP